MAESGSLLFGEMLLQQNKIGRHDLDRATRKQAYFHRRIGEILVMMGCVNPEEVKLQLLWQKEINHGYPFTHRLDPRQAEFLFGKSRRSH